MNCFMVSIQVLVFLQNVKIDKTQIEQLQYNLLKSHACGLGEEVPKDIVKLMLMLKIKSLSYGHSGVQIDTVKRLMEMYNNDVQPIIYTQGSLGASGDLAPLSHLSLPLIGSGRSLLQRHVKHKTDFVMNELGWQPVQLKSKEGLALDKRNSIHECIWNVLFKKVRAVIKDG